MKLTTKLMLGLGLAASVFAPLLGFSVFYSARNILYTAITGSHKNMAEHTMTEVGRLLYLARRELQAIAEEETLEEWFSGDERGEYWGEDRTASIASIRRTLEEKMFLSGPWYSLCLVNLEGAVIAESDRARSGRSLSPGSAVWGAFNAARQGEVYHSDLVVPLGVGRPTVIFAAPIRAEDRPDRPVVGAVIGRYAWHAVLQLLDELDPSLRVSLLNREGTVIGTRTGDKKRILQESLLSVGLVKRALRGDHRLSDVYLCQDGTKVLGTLMPDRGFLNYRGNRWGVLIEVPTSEVFGPIFNLGRETAIVVLAIMAVSASLLFAITRRMIRPIGALTKAAQAVAAGDFDTRIEAATRDEIGFLAIAFNEMTENLKVSMTDLKASNGKLRRTQAQLVQSGKLSAVGELAAGVAHEINNPLTGVLTYALLLKGQLEDIPESIRLLLPKFSEWLDLIKLSAERCKSISDNLLAFSRQSDTKMTRVDLPDVVSRTFDLLVVHLRLKQIKLNQEIKEDLPSILGNSNQLQQVITNIVLNAVWFSENGGEISCCVNREGDMCKVAISDTGPGISPENLEKIFDPFFTTKPIGKGTGLGLSLSYGIIEDHKGRISVDSKLGRGTSFYIHLPVYTDDALFRSV